MKIPERKDADKKYTWRTEDLFATDEIWEQHYNELDKETVKIEEFQNTCTKDAASLLECLKLYNDICEELDRIYVYAYMKFHEDSTNSKYQQLSGKADTLAVKIMSASSFIVPKISSLPADTIKTYMNE